MDTILTWINNGLTLVGALSLIKWLIIFCTKKIFKDVYEFNRITKKILERRPNERNSFQKIDLNLGIDSFDITKLENRYSIKDVQEYIKDLEVIKQSKFIVNYNYGIRSFLDHLYEFKKELNNNDEFKIKQRCLILLKFLESSSVKEKFFLKFSKRWFYYPFLKRWQTIKLKRLQKKFTK